MILCGGLLGGVLIGCGADNSGKNGTGGTAGNCEKGTLDCVCTKKGECDEGLECVEDLCIDPNAPTDTGTETGDDTAGGQPGPCPIELDVQGPDVTIVRKWVDFETGEIMEVAGTPDASTGLDFALVADPSVSAPPNALPQIVPGARIGNLSAFDMVAAADCQSATDKAKGDALTSIADGTSVFVIETTDGKIYTVGEFAYPMSMDPMAPPPVEFWWNDPCDPNFLCP